MNVAEQILKRLTPETTSQVFNTISMNVEIEFLGRDITFCSNVVTPSMNNLALELSGHSPEKEYRFDPIKFEDWCRDHYLICLESPFFKGYVVHTQNDVYWWAKYTQSDKKRCADALQEKLWIYDMKNGAMFPTLVESVRKCNDPYKPEIERFYLGDELILEWNHDISSSLEEPLIK